MTSSDLRYVAHLDILGMSTIVMRDPEEAWSLLSDLVGVRNRLHSLELEFRDDPALLPVRDHIHVVTFSDTILLFTNRASRNDLRCLVIAIAEIFHKALCKCVPIRAGIAKGVFCFNLDESMYVGPALIDAYEIGEAAEWLGVTIHETAAQDAVDLGMTSGGSDVVVGWDVPIKTGARYCHVINWPAVSAHDLTITPPVSMSQFYRAFETTFGPFDELEESARAKYEHTVTFMNHCLAIHGTA